MKAVVLHEVDGPLALEDVPEPTGEHIVDVRAAGVNFADVLIRRGLYPQMPELPFVPGNEVAGSARRPPRRRVPGARAAATRSGSRSIRTGCSRCPRRRRSRPAPRFCSRT